MKYNKEIEIDLTPAEIAQEVAGMSNIEQAQFFNHLGAKFSKFDNPIMNGSDSQCIDIVKFLDHGGVAIIVNLYHFYKLLKEQNS